MCMGICLLVCLFTTSMQCPRRPEEGEGQKKVGPLELYLQTIVHLHMGAESQTWIVWLSPFGSEPSLQPHIWISNKLTGDVAVDI